MCDVGSEYSANTDSLVIVEIYLMSRQSKRVLRLSGARCPGGYHAKRLNYVVQSLLYWFWPLRPLCGWGFGGVLTLVVLRPLRLEISQQRLLSLGRRGPFLLHDPVWLTRVCLLQLSGPGFFSLVFGTFYILPAFFLKYALFDTSLVNSTCFVTTSICLSVCLSIHLPTYSTFLPIPESNSITICPGHTFPTHTYEVTLVDLYILYITV